MGEQDNSNKRLDTIVFTSLIILGLAIRLLLLYSVPISEAPDEGAHQWVIQFIHDYVRLPTTADANGPSYYEALPPFGYIPHVLTTFLLPTPFLTLSARFGGLISYFVVIVFGYFCSKELFPKQRVLRLALPAVLAFHPQLCFIQAYANSDATAAALAAVALYLSLRIVRLGADLKSVLMLGLVSTWLLLSKYTGSSIVPVVLFALIPAALIHGDGRAKAVKTFGIAVGIPVLLCGAWFYRNNLVFNGDSFGTKLMIARWVELFHPPLTPLYKFPVITHIQWRREAFMSFWGLFGNLNRPLPQIFYISLELLTEVAVVAWAFFAVRNAISTVGNPSSDLQRLFKATDGGSNPSRRESLTDVVVWGLLWFCALSGLAALVASAVSPATSMTPPQARYLFPAEIPCAALMLKGFSLLPRSTGNYLTFALNIILVASCLYMLCMLVPLYGLNINPMR